MNCTAENNAAVATEDNASEREGLMLGMTELWGLTYQARHAPPPQCTHCHFLNNYKLQLALGNE